MCKKGDHPRICREVWHSPDRGRRQRTNNREVRRPQLRVFFNACGRRPRRRSEDATPKQVTAVRQAVLDKTLIAPPSQRKTWGARRIHLRKPEGREGRVMLEPEKKAGLCVSPGKTQGLCFSPGKSSGTVQHQGKEMQPGLQREGGKGSHTGGKAGTAPRRCVGSARVSQCAPATAKTRGMLLARLGAPRRPKTVVGKKEEGRRRRRRKIGTHTKTTKDW